MLKSNLANSNITNNNKMEIEKESYTEIEIINDGEEKIE